MNLQERIQWVAGLVEGEGCIYKRPDGCYRIQVAMTDKDVLEKAQGYTGMGRVYPRPSKTELDRKAMYQWIVYRQGEVYALLAMLYQSMCKRRKAAMHKALEAMREAKPWRY